MIAEPVARPLLLGTAGMHGGVSLRAERIGGRTRITNLACRPPLQVLRAHHAEPARPDLASVILASPAGGILQGDLVTIDIRVGPGARLRLGTQSATRIYRTPTVEAQQLVRLEVEAGGYLEYMPGPFIPYAGSTFTSSTTAVVDSRGALIIGEVVGPGRAARGEILAFERFSSRVGIERGDGELLATDAVILDRREPMRDVGALGPFVAIGTLLVIRPGFPASTLLDGGSPGDRSATMVGASSLPNDAGAWFRALTGQLGEAVRIIAAAGEAARRVLLETASSDDAAATGPVSSQPTAGA